MCHFFYRTIKFIVMMGGWLHMKMERTGLNLEEERNTCQRFSVEEYIARKYGIEKEDKNSEKNGKENVSD